MTDETIRGSIPNAIQTPPKNIPEMTDREIAEETLYWLRQAGTALATLQSGGMGSIMSMMLGRK